MRRGLVPATCRGLLPSGAQSFEAPLSRRTPRFREDRDRPLFQPCPGEALLPNHPLPSELLSSALMSLVFNEATLYVRFVDTILKVGKPFHQGSETNGVRLKEANVKHLPIIVAKSVKYLPRRYEAQCPGHRNLVVDDITVAINFSKEMLLVTRHIFGEVAIKDRISGYVGVIKAVKIIPMPGIVNHLRETRPSSNKHEWQWPSPRKCAPPA